VLTVCTSAHKGYVDAQISLLLVVISCHEYACTLHSQCNIRAFCYESWCACS